MPLEKVLIVKIGAIGDVVMAMPLLTYFKKKNEKVHLTWVAGKTVDTLLKLSGMVDSIISVDEAALFKGSMCQKFGELFRVQAALLGQSFDLAITGHVDWRYRLLSATARCKDRRFFQRGKLRQCPVPGRYHGDEYVRLGSGLDDSEIVESELPELFCPKSKYADEGPFIVLAPGGAANILAVDALRRWPIQYYVELCRKFEESGIRVFLSGAPSDAWIVPHFEGLSCKNLVGQLDLIELIGLLQSSRLLITHDSGPLHLAKLARCQAIGIFGPTNPKEKVGLNEKVEVLWGGEHLACRPCYDGKTYAPCKRNQCLQQILPEAVYRKALAFLQG